MVLPSAMGTDSTANAQGYENQKRQRILVSFVLVFANKKLAMLLSCTHSVILFFFLIFIFTLKHFSTYDCSVLKSGWVKQTSGLEIAVRVCSEP